MNRRYIAPLVTLLALTITSILNIVYGISLYKSTIRLLIVFVIFYIIGKIAEKIIASVIEKDRLRQMIELELLEKQMEAEKALETEEIQEEI